jgi:hypothetical protein
VDRSTQAEDRSEAAHKTAREAHIKGLEEHLQALTAENKELVAKLRDTQDLIAVWRHKAQAVLLGHMSITILCPRAECTVNGSHLEMDGWNPEKLRAEFEREVLPRYTRVFVEEEDRFGKGALGSSRPEVVDQAMREFADIFRERLSAMLSAPSAAAAVANTTGKEVAAPHGTHGPQTPNHAGASGAANAHRVGSKSRR